MRAKEIYLSSNATIEERRLLLSYAFSNIYIISGQIKPEHTKAFNFLAEWMPKTNQIFELEKTYIDIEKFNKIASTHSKVLQGLYDVRTSLSK